MSTRRQHRPSSTRRRLRPAVVGLLCLLGGVTAGASEVGPAHGFNEAAHRLLCDCAKCRGASCCCGHRAAPAEAAPKPEPRPSPGDAASCLSAAPCGGGEVPTAPPSPSGAKLAALATHPVARRPHPVGRPTPRPAASYNPPTDLPPAEPPEAPAFA